MSGSGDVTGDSGHRLDRVRLTGISATGYHGVFEHERREGQTFLADVVVHLDTRRAAATDDLAHTLHYGVLAEQVAAVLAGEPADLVETVAERIAATVLAHPLVQAVDVAVHKPQAPITVPFHDVVVEIRRDRTWLPAAEPLRADAAPAAQPEVASPWHPVAEGAPAVEVAPVASPATAPMPTVGGAVAVPAVPVPPLAASAVPLAPPAALPVPVPALAPDPVLLGAAPAAVPGADDDTAEGELVQDALDLAPEEPVEVVLAIGSNLGAAQETLRQAVADLADVPGLEITAVSALARTAPVGGPDQPDFLNAVLVGRTMLSARDLLRATAGVEQVHGRERTVHWGPRTLDVDIIVYGAVSAVTDDLELPHPRAHERAFVLQPWAQVQPDAVLHGLGGGPVAALAATAPDRDGVRWLALDWLTGPTPGEGAPEPAPAGGPATTAWLPDPDEQPDRPPVVDGPPAVAPAFGSAPRERLWPEMDTPSGRQDP